MKKALSLGAVALLVTALSLFLVGTALAQEPEPSPTPAPRPFLGGVWHRVCSGAGLLSDVITDLLGMTPEEIAAEQAAGKTLAEIASEKGLSDDDLANALLSSLREAVEEAKVEGRITWEQFDRLFARGRFGGRGGKIGRFAPVPEAVTDLLGMTAEELHAERAAGKTLSEIAAERGVSDQQLIDSLLDFQKEAVERALEEGRITEAQAEWLLAREQALAPFTLTNPFGPGRWDGRGWPGSGLGLRPFAR